MHEFEQRQTAIKESENMRSASNRLLRREGRVLDAPWQVSRSGIVETDSIPRLRHRYNKGEVLIFASNYNIDKAQWVVFELEQTPEQFFMLPAVGRALVMPYRQKEFGQDWFMEGKRDATLDEIREVSSILEHTLKARNVAAFPLKKPSTISKNPVFYEKLPERKSNPAPAPLEYSEISPYGWRDSPNLF